MAAVRGPSDGVRPWSGDSGNSPPASGRIRMSPACETPARKAPSGEEKRATAVEVGQNFRGDRDLGCSPPDASSIAARRNQPRRIGDLAEDPLSIGKPLGSVALGRSNLAHVSGSHRNEHGNRGGNEMARTHFPVRRQASSPVVFAEAQGRRAIRRPEKQRITVVKKHRAAVTERDWREGCDGWRRARALDPWTAMSHGCRPASPSARAARARRGRCRRDAGTWPGPRTISLQLSGERHGHERRTAVPHLLLRREPDLVAVGGPCKPKALGNQPSREHVAGRGMRTADMGHLAPLAEGDAGAVPGHPHVADRPIVS